MSVVELTKARTEPDVVKVPTRVALAIEGKGEPGGDAFQRSLSALFGIAYTIKFTRKKTGKQMDLSPLEGDWWFEGKNPRFEKVSPKHWRWRLKIAIPKDVTVKELRAAIDAATSKKGGKLFESAEAHQVVIRKEPAHRCGRILHVGPYDQEPRSFEVLQKLLNARGLHRVPWHTEIYLSDPRRTKPEKIKTVLLVDLVS